ncbi:zinc finger protein on ecdysone puffs-like [Stegodyphus dumicola]|uniref:zinc finger protein on ecdysone puffs-like n=1 Tax=Stegodyphus dumicola TaxID=202533 RepID=UPI0015A7DC46|nr:zinc finger protein on ecdysone puffs-like [Stegodyphus dumicola]
MSYRNQYSGSPWQQGGPPFGVGSYNQSYGGYNDQYGGVSHQMMNTGYSRSQGYGGGMYGGGGMGQMRNMGYGSGPSPSRHYMNDRMGGRSLPRGQLPRKRLPQRKSSYDRRVAKPRRRRDSRGGSKGRHDRSEDEDDDETYNPEEPTDDISDIDCDMFECWKSSDEDGEPKDEKAGAKENGEAEANEEEKEPLICYVCKVKCSTRERLTKHQNSKSHTSKIEELLAIRREKKKDTTDDDKKDKDSTDDRKKSSRKPGNWCTVCECAFSGNFLAHRRTKEHRKKRDKKYPKCRPCRLGFSSSEEYRDHYKSEEHKQRSAEFHYLKNLASGSDEDEAAIEPVKIIEEEKPETVEKMEEDTAEIKEEKADGEAAAEDKEKDKTEDATQGDDAKEKEDAKEESKEKEKKEEKEKDKEEKKEPKKSKPKEPKSVGQSFVISVQGYYCKLCHKFFKDVTVAKSKHCRSIMHSEAFKKAMAEAIEQEEERQKLAEEQDKQDREAAEAAELAAEIAAVERAAKEAIKKELAAKKASQSKDQDVEMKDVSDSSKDKGGRDGNANEDGIENGLKDDGKMMMKVKKQKNLMIKVRKRKLVKKNLLRKSKKKLKRKLHQVQQLDVDEGVVEGAKGVKTFVTRMCNFRHAEHVMV